MEVGELQDWSSVVSGWARGSFVVYFSYAFKALSNISWKLEDDAGVECVLEMRVGVDDSFFKR